MKTLTSELESRAGKARQTLEALNKAGIVIDGIKLAEAHSAFKFTEANGQLVCIVNEVKKAQGEPKMVQVAWGVKASIVLNEKGAAIINSFSFDADRYDQEKAADWLRENKKSLEDSYATIQESMPAGSFEDITCRLYDALRTANYFPVSSEGFVCWYVVCVFPDRVIIQCGEQAWQVGFSDKDNIITLGAPVKVTTEFVAMECAKIKAEGAFTYSIEKVTIREASNKADASKHELIAVLIEEGISASKNRYYPAEALREAAPLFASLKNYIDHPTSDEERAKPERSINDWVSTITESWYEDGKIMGKIKIHTDWLWEKLQDPVFRENIGLSINANGKRTIKEVNGKPMEVIEKIFAPKSVDWVTEPGARGRVAHLLESGQINSNQGDKEMLKTVKLEEVKAERPDLVNVIESEARVKFNAEQAPIIDQKIKEATTPLHAEIKAMKDKEVLLAETGKITKLVEASKLPKVAQTKLIAQLSANVFGDETKLNEAVKTCIESELKYLQETGGIKLGLGGAVDATAGLSAFEKRCGLKEEKKD